MSIKASWGFSHEVKFLFRHRVNINQSINQLSIPGLDAWNKHQALPWQQAHCKKKSPLSFIGSIIINHWQMTAFPAGSLCVHDSVLIPWPRWPASSPCVSAKAVVVTHWHLWQRSQIVKAFLADAHAVLSLTSVTGRHHKFPIHTLDVNMENMTVLVMGWQGGLWWCWLTLHNQRIKIKI